VVDMFFGVFVVLQMYVIILNQSYTLYYVIVQKRVYTKRRRLLKLKKSKLSMVLDYINVVGMFYAITNVCNCEFTSCSIA